MSGREGRTRDGSPTATPSSRFDVIGDVHGNADELVELLKSMGYRDDLSGTPGTWAHPERTAIFVGDLIDRGPRIADTLDIVYRMWRHAGALCVLGNHEWNALAWSVRAPGGGFLREHTLPHWRQHREFLKLPPALRARALDWFRKLPFHVSLDNLRVAHAAWNRSDIAVIDDALARHGGLTDAFLVEAHGIGRLRAAVNWTLKGPEMTLPRGLELVDKEGKSRREVRVRWFESPAGKTIRSWAIPSDERLPELPLDEAVLPATEPYAPTEPLVFFGHYWLSGATPAPLATNLVCLDWSVAKGGPLCAYRFDGEAIADPGRMRTVRKVDGQTFEYERLLPLPTEAVS